MTTATDFFANQHSSTTPSKIVINGTPSQNQVLTASFTNVNNPTNVDYTWLRNGNVIIDATTNTYTLTQTDVGSSLSVQVSYDFDQLVKSGYWLESFIKDGYWDNTWIEDGYYEETWVEDGYYEETWVEDGYYEETWIEDGYYEETWVEDGYYEETWIEDGYYEETWVEDGYYEETWIEDGYYEETWIEDGYYEETWIEDGYYVRGSAGYYWVDTSHSENIWVDTSYSEEVWVDTSYSADVWVDTSYSEEVWVDTSYSEEVWVDTSYSEEVWVDTSYSEEVWVDTSYSEEIWVDTSYPENVWVDTSHSEDIWVDTSYTDKTWVEPVYNHFHSSASSIKTTVVSNVNDKPTGIITISDNTPTEGQTLTVSSALLQDMDGLGIISYNWKAGTNLLGVGESYTVSSAALGKKITVIANYTDLQGTAESVNSSDTGVVTPSVGAGFSFNPSTQQATGENGTTARYSLHLNTAPKVNQNVILTFTSSDTSEGVIDNPSLTFTSTNWFISQTLTVRGIDDNWDDGTIPYQVTAKVSTLDVFYKALTINPFNLTNADDGFDKIRDEYGDFGGSRNDDLIGGNGADKLHGLNMADNLAGGLSNDTLWGGYGDDNLFGEAGDDKLLGEQENDYLEGGAGNDWLDGGEGLDTMIGGVGNDTYYLGYDAVDVIDDQGLSSDVDTIIMPYQLNKYTLPKGIEQGAIAASKGSSSLTGNSSNNSLTGNEGKNILNGATGQDSLFGGAGDDVLKGGVGNDALSGGSGKDSFVFDAALKANLDKITDFKPVDDTIKLDNQIFTQLSTLGVLNATQFYVGSAAHDPNDYVIYNPSTGVVTYDSDASGAGQGVQIAQLGVNLPITNADFVVI